MVFRNWLVSSALLILSGAGVSAQQKPAEEPAPLVQPGAPGQSSKVWASAAGVPTVRVPTQADISFMQGMIMHHSQAVEMSDLMKTRTTNKQLLAFGAKISISQTDEIQYMKQWLEDRNAPTTMSNDMSKMGDMKNMPGMSHMDVPMLMPGMLTPEQMKALAAATGPAFDHLFLTGMIQHHGGALTMVQDLFNTAGAGQDAVLFDFATDIDNTQSAEILIMQGMLREEK